jgi:hypothetical protein
VVDWGIDQMRLLEWARTNAGVISTVGALIVFFSWAVTNTLGQRYGRLKASLETGQSTFRLYTTLHELRDQLNSLAMEVVQSRKATDASRFTSGSTADVGLDTARARFDQTRLSAHQIKELMDFTAETHSFSRAASTTTAMSHTIDGLLGEVGKLADATSRLLAEAERHHTNRPEDREPFLNASARYVEFVRNEAIPQVGPFFQRIVDAANARRREAEDELARARSRSERASRVALVLYVFGSVLVIGGQFVDKTRPKVESSQAAVQRT